MASLRGAGPPQGLSSLAHSLERSLGVPTFGEGECVLDAGEGRDRGVVPEATYFEVEPCQAGADFEGVNHDEGRDREQGRGQFRLEPGRMVGWPWRASQCRVGAVLIHAADTHREATVFGQVALTVAEFTRLALALHPIEGVPLPGLIQLPAPVAHRSLDVAAALAVRGAGHFDEAAGPE